MDYKNYNDYELVYMVNENEECFDILYNKYQYLINKQVSIFYNVLKNYGVEYEDLKQEADIAFYNTINSFRDNNLVYTFIIVSIKNKLLNYSKKIFANKNIINSSAVSLFSSVYDDKETILLDIVKSSDNNETSNYVSSKLLEKDLYLFKYELSIDNSYVYELLLNGFSRSEISILLDINPKKISNIFFKVRKCLKNYLNSI